MALQNLHLCVLKRIRVSSSGPTPNPNSGGSSATYTLGSTSQLRPINAMFRFQIFRSLGALRTRSKVVESLRKWTVRLQMARIRSCNWWNQARKVESKYGVVVVNIYTPCNPGRSLIQIMHSSSTMNFFYHINEKKPSRLPTKTCNPRAQGPKFYA